MLDHQRLGELYMAAAIAGNRRGALTLMVEAYGAGAEVSELRGVVAAAQREIGCQWAAAQLSVGEEHMATAISNIVLARLHDLAPLAEPNGKKIVIACVEGELHDLPARLVCDALDAAGFEVKFLGASVPADDIADRVRAEKPDLLALSVTMRDYSPALREAVAAVRAVAPRLPIAIGGGAHELAAGDVAQLRVAIVGGSADELVATARAALEV